MIVRLLAAALAVLVAGAVVWTLWKGAGEAPPTATPTSAATPLPSATPPPTIVPGYRLAGTAAGLRGRYGVFADPGGRTEMYKIGDEIPGLGKLTRVGEYDASVDTSAGELRFQVRPAPTTPPEDTPTAVRATTPSPPPDPSESESSPSDEPAPPAS